MRCEHKRQKAHGALPENLSLGGGGTAHCLKPFPHLKQNIYFRAGARFGPGKLFCARNVYIKDSNFVGFES